MDYNQLAAASMVDWELASQVQFILNLFGAGAFELCTNFMISNYNRLIGELYFSFVPQC